MKQKVKTGILGLVVAAFVGTSSLGIAMTIDETKAALEKLTYINPISATNAITVKPGNEQAFEALIPELRKQLTSEKGVLVFAVGRSLENPSLYSFYGEWGSPAAFLYHINRDDQAFKDLRNEIGNLTVKQSISLFEKYK